MAFIPPVSVPPTDGLEEVVHQGKQEGRFEGLFRLKGQSVAVKKDSLKLGASKNDLDSVVFVSTRLSGSTRR